ncbi:MAG: GTPase Era [Steroidobacteraceae bacterium]
MDPGWPQSWLRQQLGYEARDPELFRAALTHRSASGRNNERLEFLGDAVLNMVIAERLYERFPLADEGDLSRLRARVVSAEPLAGIAQGLQLGDELQLGSGELKSGGFRRQSILADALEAVIGAVYLDGGFEPARAVIMRFFDPCIDAAPHPAELKDAKTRLQELLQARGLPLPRYSVEGVEGDPHEQQFRVRCDVPALSASAAGSGSSRRRAEQQAAQVLLEMLAGEAPASRARGGPVSAFRAGFAALVGRPNVGKSTLLNALVGEKLSIVTPRPQTTRHRIIGIVNRPAAQIAFVDTPGLHQGGRRALNRALNRTAAAALADADVVVMVVEAGRWTDEDDLVLGRIREAGLPAVAVVNKVDRVRPRERLLPYVARLAERHDFRAIVPVAARSGENLERLAEAIVAELPESPQMFPEERTDKDLRFRIAEIVREKLTLELNQEVPYGIAVEVESLREEDGQPVCSAVVWVDREGQKPIVIGARGARLKRIGTAARREINALTGQRWHLELWVKVRENWADNAQALRALGLE